MVWNVSHCFEGKADGITLNALTVPALIQVFFWSDSLQALKKAAEMLRVVETKAVSGLRNAKSGGYQVFCFLDHETLDVFTGIRPCSTFNHIAQITRRHTQPVSHILNRRGSLLKLSVG